MAAFFDFLERIGYGDAGWRRMNLRHAHIIEPLKAELQGARVLDLGSADGRWPYAIAAAGAREVVGIEGRASSAAKFKDFPEAPFKRNVRIAVGDFVKGMDDLLAAGERFDVVFCLGVYYHTMEHHRILQQMTAFQPKAIVIDSVFSTGRGASIFLLKNTPGSIANAIAGGNAGWSVVGTPTIAAVQLMGESFGYSTQEVIWNPELSGRPAVRDYFAARGKRRKRGTLILRPQAYRSVVY